jgi:hypothetical protein
MIISWQGREYELDFSDITIKQAETVEKLTGMTIGAWLGMVSTGFDINSAQFLPMLKVIYWLMLDQNGEKTPAAAVDFPMLRFGRAFMAGAAAEAAAAGEPVAEPGPTQIPSPGTAPPGLSTPPDGMSSPPAADPATAPG